MARQINLYDPGLRQRREWLTLPNLGIAMAAVAAVVVAWGMVERSRLGVIEQEAGAVAAESKAAQDEIAALAAKNTAGADARVEAELAAARALLADRREVVEVLRRSASPATMSFAGSLRALARQTPTGLWLTGFTIGAGDAGAEIKGRMTDPALLPEFVRRLNTEPAFAGRSFAALEVGVPKPVTSAAGAPGTAPATPAIQVPPPYHEFTLVPKVVRP